MLERPARGEQPVEAPTVGSDPQGAIHGLGEGCHRPDAQAVGVIRLVPVMREIAYFRIQAVESGMGPNPQNPASVFIERQHEIADEAPWVRWIVSVIREAPGW